MITSRLFWILLAGSVLLHWLIPRRWRLGFLALVSIGYVVLATDAEARGLTSAVVITAILLAWSLLFYFLAPLSVRVRSIARPVIAKAPVFSQPILAGVGGSELPPQPEPSDVPPSLPLAPVRDRRWVFWSLIGGILAYLGWFKYIAPLLYKSPRGTLLVPYVLPLGISYFTFKFIHYVIEVARGNIRERSIWNYLCYVFLYPVFTAGPIERFDHFLRNCDETPGTQMFVEGVTRITHGLIKKFFFAEMIFKDDFDLAANVNGAFLLNLSSYSTFKLWRIAITVYLYIYLDFSGYCDVALGACRLYGINNMENFNFPFLATNLGDFWKRWHMTLSGWCQTYIYMPVLGLTRRPNLATYATFMAIGMWHGASPKWILWGAYHATGLFIYQKWVRRSRQLKWTFVRTLPWQLAGIALTTLFVSAGDLLTFTQFSHSHDIVRVMGKLVFLRIR